MTTGTALAFIFTGVTGPAAIVGGIWLEQRMPDRPHLRVMARSPGPVPRARPAARRPPGLAASISPEPAHRYGQHHR